MIKTSILFILFLNLFAQEKEHVLTAEQSIVKAGEKKYWDNSYVWILERDLVIESGAKLVIGPGTKIKFKPNTDLGASGRDITKGEVIVIGELIAEGDVKVSSNIYFTSAAANDKAKSNDWGGIIFYKNANNLNSKLKYCNITYAYRGISIIGSSPSIKQSSILYSFNSGIFISTKSKSVIDGNVLQGNGNAGIEVVIQSIPKIVNNYISQNEFGIMIFDSSKPNIGDSLDLNSGNNRIADNFQYDIYNNASSKILAQNNVWVSNDIKEIEKLIFDQNDQSSSGPVLIKPVLILKDPNASALAELNKNKTSIKNSTLNDKNTTSSKEVSKEVSKETQKVATQTLLASSTKNQKLKENDKSKDVVQKQADPIVIPTSSVKELAANNDVQAETIQATVNESVSKVVEDNYTEISLQTPYITNSLESGGAQLNKIEAIYSGQAKDLKIHGKVVLRLIVNLDGTVEKALVLKTDHKYLEPLAVEAGLKIVFSPAFIKGQPVKFEKTQIFKF